MGKIGCIIQARMGSTRLPGKVMKDLEGEPVLYHVIERVKKSKLIDEIIIATTKNERDDVIVKEAKRNLVKYFRGSEENVLSRYYYSAVENNLDVVVRVTSDCPLIDPEIIDDIVEFYLNNDFKLVTNAGIDLSERTYPRGMDTEVFSMDFLKEIHEMATEQYQKEHVTTYIYENYADEIYYYKNDVDYSEYRLTLDTLHDFKLIKEVYKELYKGKHDFYLTDILKLFKEQPTLKKINKKIKQKGLKE